MTTVRFSQVVQTAGKPEVYLLFAKDDPDFDKALKQDRIMTVTERGSSPPFGVVGHEEGHHGQLLLFPKSLKKFAGMRIVGVKFDLLTETPAHQAAAAPPNRPKLTPARKPKAKKAPKAAAKIAPARKVISFPKAELSLEDGRIGQLKKEARRALLALEQGRSDAASRHLLRLLKG
jgi:hypothetical protein